jgi:hypothetical protein
MRERKTDRQTDRQARIYPVIIRVKEREDGEERGGNREREWG